LPWLVIVAGPNGSGKTTLVRSGVLSAILSVPELSINPDDIARDLASGAQPTPEQSLHAAQLADAQLDAAIASAQPAIVETVLSSDKFKSRVETSQALGYQVALIYVTLREGALNVMRVIQRKRQGGHDVPAERILARRTRSHALFAWFAHRADLVLVFDNTGTPVRAAGKLDGTWRLWAVDRLPDDLAATITALAG
jgi:predicted ABC-type ATPase